jgi:hypothetical protein
MPAVPNVPKMSMGKTSGCMTGNCPGSKRK